MTFDSEEARLVDRIQATAFFQAKEAGATFITKNGLQIVWKDQKIGWKEIGERNQWNASQIFRNVVVLKVYRKNPRILLCSMPERLRQVREAGGGQTDY